MGDRRRQRGGRYTRRAYVAGWATLAGGLLTLGTAGYTRVTAQRQVQVSVSEDSTATLGLDTATALTAGADGQRLVTVTNNTNETLSVAVALADGAAGSVSPASASLAPGESQEYTVDVTDEANDPLTFDLDASGGGLSVTLSRDVRVRQLLRQIEDRTANSNAYFYLSYRVTGVTDFDRFEVTVRNVDASYIADRTYTSLDSEGVLRIPESGSDGGTAGDTYEFDTRVYDAGGQVIQEIVTDVADGENPNDNDDIGGGPNDPKLESFSVTDDSVPQRNQTRFVVDYEVSNTGQFQDVQVVFDNTENDWSDETVTSTDAPTGSVSYPPNQQSQGGTTGQEYDITVRVRNQNGLVTDSDSVTDVADGTDP